MAKEILEKARALTDWLVNFRRDLHQHPELGMEEVRTAGLVADRLRALGVEVRTGVGGTGVVGLIRGARPGPTIALRADMDALPIQDQKQVPYASQVPGKMHACGHDGHTTMLLGAATLLAGMKEELRGNVKFLFQPAEEGPGGAIPMIEAGALEDPRVDAVVGLHLHNDLPVGQIGIRYGTTNASTDSFEIKILGEGGHGAYPHGAVDAVVVAAQVVMGLQTLVSRETDPLDSVVLTVGTINGGYRHNVIADQVVMTGTIRTLDPKTREAMPQRMERVLQGITQAGRARYELKINPGYASVFNEERITRLVEETGRELLGAENVVLIPRPSMGGEDFAYFAQRVPGCFFRLGSRNEEKGIVFPGHHPKYDFDEGALPIGVGMLVQTVLHFQERW